MDMASKTSCQISMMMSGHSLRVCVMCPGSMMMSNVCLRVAVMMMRVLSLVLLKAHQAFVQIRVVPKIIGVLMNVAMYVAVKMPMNATLHRRGFVMMLVRIQHLLHALQLLLVGALLLRRQAGVIFQLLVQLVVGCLKQIRSCFQQRTRTRS